MDRSLPQGDVEKDKLGGRPSLNRTISGGTDVPVIGETIEDGQYDELDRHPSPS